MAFREQGSLQHQRKPSLAQELKRAKWAVVAAGSKKEEARPLGQAPPISLVPPNLMTPSCGSEKGKSRTLATLFTLKGANVAETSLVLPPPLTLRQKAQKLADF
jgi:hypothetical protein